MAIEQRINKPPTNLGAYTLFLSGDKKVGKTAFCSGFPNHFIFEFEPGNANHLKCCFEDIPTLKIFDKVLAEAEKTPWFETVIVDEINVLYELLMQQVLNVEKVLDLSDLDFGKGWGAVARRFNSYIRRLQALKGGNIYTGHSEVKEFKDRQGKKTNKLEARLSKHVAKMMDSYSHLWGVMLFGDKGVRELHIEGDAYMKAGHGFKKEHFLLIKEGTIPLGNSEKEAFRNFMLGWDNKPIPGSVPVKQNNSKTLAVVVPKRKLGVTVRRK